MAGRRLGHCPADSSGGAGCGPAAPGPSSSSLPGPELRSPKLTAVVQARQEGLTPPLVSLQALARPGCLLGLGVLIPAGGLWGRWPGGAWNGTELGGPGAWMSPGQVHISHQMPSASLPRTWGGGSWGLAQHSFRPLQGPPGSAGLTSACPCSLPTFGPRLGHRAGVDTYCGDDSLLSRPRASDTLKMALLRTQSGRTWSR